MSNMEIYSKTISFSVRKLLYDFLALIFLAAACILGFVIADKATNMGLIGLAIGLVVGLIVIGIITHFYGYVYKAGQIAMMTKAITEGELPEDVIGEGKRIVKERFTTVAVFYAATGLIKGIFNELGKGLNAIGRAVGGDNGETVTSVINSVIQVIISYLSDCCLGWVFFRAGQKATKATLEGAVLFFRHGKTFLKNMGRVFGMGAVSLLAIGGVFTGIFYLIDSRFPALFETLAAEITEASARMETEIPEILQDPKVLMIVVAAIGGIIVWSFIHSTFIRPFVLVGVLRNYLESGMKDIPTEDSFDELDSVSKKFAKAHKKLAVE